MTSDIPVLKIDLQEPRGYTVTVSYLGEDSIYDQPLYSVLEASECALIFKEEWEKETGIIILPENIIISKRCLDNNKSFDLDARRIVKEIEKRGIRHVTDNSTDS